MHQQGDWHHCINDEPLAKNNSTGFSGSQATILTDVSTFAYNALMFILPFNRICEIFNKLKSLFTGTLTKTA